MSIGIFGAGLTGCYLGGILRASGFDVSLIARDYVLKEIVDAGYLKITDLKGRQWQVRDLQLAGQLPPQDFDVLFVTLKCHQLASAWPDILKAAKRSGCCVFLQNGLASLEPFQKDLEKCRFVSGITACNVVKAGRASYLQTSEGGFHLGAHSSLDAIAKKLNQSGFEMTLHQNIEAIQYGKLILNLNNALNAMLSVPLREQLYTRSSRFMLSGAIRELLRICDVQGIKPYKFTKVPPRLLPFVLNLPNFIFTRLAQSMLKIDPQARSSMWEDIQSKRKTEINYINGAVVDLGKKLKIPTPINEEIVAGIKDLESKY